MEGYDNWKLTSPPVAELQEVLGIRIYFDSDNFSDPEYHIRADLEFTDADIQYYLQEEYADEYVIDVVGDLMNDGHALLTFQKYHEQLKIEFFEEFQGEC